jgi:PHP family Zn ribbon phosphoesterase
VGDLDGITIISNSDAHSPQKLGREATIVRSNIAYDDIIGAIKTNDDRLVGTIEFFPEEGKYHSDGHRACNIRFTPAETAAHGGVCPVCGKPLVVGVLNRIQELSSREEGSTGHKRVEYIIPLAEVIAELHGTKSTAGKAVTVEYHNVLERLGDEFSVLRNVPLEAIEAAGFPLLKLAVERLRAGNVIRDPGFDGVYGTIKVFKDMAERQAMVNQLSLL